MHAIREEPWRQRVFRFYDYDGNVVCVAELMDALSRRLAADGLTVAEIAGATGISEDEVRGHLAESALA